MTPIEGQVVQGLINQYKSKGVNVQQILDNPLFHNLPLDAKVKAINTYAEEFSKTPSVSYSQVARNAVSVGAAAGAMAAMSKFMVGGRASPRTLGIVSGIGALVGAGNSLLSQGSQIRKDRVTSKYINTGNTLDALVQRSLHSIPRPTSNALLDTINTQNVSTIGEHLDLERPDGSRQQVTLYDKIKYSQGT